MLLNKGLAGDFSATIVKLILSKHGYSDRESEKVRTVSPIAGRASPVTPGVWSVPEPSTLAYLAQVC